MAKKTTTEVTFEVKEKIGVISQNGNTNLELRFVSWNNDDGKYDIRSWWTDDMGQEKCGKGIRLTKDELLKLSALIDTLK